ncbi:MAG: DNA repair protein RecO [bacterium JZ-2024 1]
MAEEIYCEGIVLHRKVGRNGNKEVIVWTDRLGKITAVAKGAAKSEKWSGRFEPLNHLELKIIRSRRGYRIIRADVIQAFLNREKPEEYYRRSIPFLHLLLSSVVSEMPLPEVFPLFLSLLQALGECQHPERAYAYFSAEILRQLGGPRINVAKNVHEACQQRLSEAEKKKIMEGWAISLNVGEPVFLGISPGRFRKRRL